MAVTGKGAWPLTTVWIAAAWVPQFGDASLFYRDTTLPPGSVDQTGVMEDWFFEAPPIPPAPGGGHVHQTMLGVG